MDLRINIVPKTAEREEEKRKHILRVVKIVILGGAMTAASALAGFFFVKFLERLEGSDLLISAICAGVFVILLILSAFFMKSITARIFWMALAALVPPLATLVLRGIGEEAFRENLPIALAGGGLFLLFIMMGMERSAATLKNSIEVKFFTTAKSLAPKAITGILILFSALFYLSYFRWGTFNEELLKRGSDNLLLSAEPLAQAWFGDKTVGVESSVDEVLRKIAEGQVASQLKDLAAEGEDRVPLSELIEGAGKEKLIAQFEAELKRTLEEVAGPVGDEEKTKDVLYRIGKKYITDTLFKFGMTPYVGIALTILVFFVMKSLSFGVGWALEIAAFMVYKVLMAMHFARMIHTDVKREEIVL